MVPLCPQQLEAAESPCHHLKTTKTHIYSPVLHKDTDCAHREHVSRTFSETVAVLQKFLCDVCGELAADFPQTFIGRVHTFCQGPTLVFTCNR